ncbi:MAG: hypothetical protein R2755_03555 [Acidimicrobiales bacterium]
MDRRAQLLRGHLLQAAALLRAPSPSSNRWCPSPSAGTRRRRCAGRRYGHGWYGINATPGETAGLLARLDELLAAEGRTRDGFKIVMGTTSDAIEPAEVDAYAEVGVTELLVPFLRQGTKHLQANLDAVMPVVEAAASR